MKRHTQRPNTRSLLTSGALGLGLSFGLLLGGCADESSDVGDDIEDAAESTGETIEEGVEETGEAFENAADEIEEETQ